MITREEHDRIIGVFLVELNHILLHTGNAELNALPGFSKEIPGYLAQLRDPDSEPHQLLYAAYAFLDEYVNANKDAVMQAVYSANTHGSSSCGP